MSKTGVATDQDQILRFKMRTPFSVEFHCQRENPKAGCIPIQPMDAPVSLSDFEGAGRQDCFERTRWKDLEAQAGRRGGRASVSFKGPFPENANFTW